jgi:predicted patatin/cPLA2 family phospholipase
MELRVALTERKTGFVRFFSSRDDVDFFEVIRATCAVPYFYGKYVTIRGEEFCDGTIGSVTGVEMLPNGSRYIVVLTRPPKALRKMILVRKVLRWLLLRKEPRALQEAIWSMPERYEEETKRLMMRADNKNVVVLRPHTSLPLVRIDSSIVRLRATVRRGYEDTMSNPNLASFFEGSDV